MACIATDARSCAFLLGLVLRHLVVLPLKLGSSYYPSATLSPLLSWSSRALALVGAPSRSQPTACTSDRRTALSLSGTSSDEQEPMCGAAAGHGSRRARAGTTCGGRAGAASACATLGTPTRLPATACAGLEGATRPRSLSTGVLPWALAAALSGARACAGEAWWSSTRRALHCGLRGTLPRGACATAVPLGRRRGGWRLRARHPMGISAWPHGRARGHLGRDGRRRAVSRPELRGSAAPSCVRAPAARLAGELAWRRDVLGKGARAATGRFDHAAGPGPEKNTQRRRPDARACCTRR